MVIAGGGTNPTGPIYNYAVDFNMCGPICGTDSYPRQVGLGGVCYNIFSSSGCPGTNDFGGNLGVLCSCGVGDCVGGNLMMDCCYTQAFPNGSVFVGSLTISVSCTDFPI